MKKLSFTALLLLLFMLAAEAQKAYSAGNLENSSRESLELYLSKAQNIKKTGSILTIAGSLSAVTGLMLAGAGESTFPLGFGMLLAGSGVTLVGLPVWITGASRAKRVTTALNTRQASASTGLAPAIGYKLNSSELQAGLKLSVRF